MIGLKTKLQITFRGGPFDGQTRCIRYPGTCVPVAFRAKRGPCRIVEAVYDYVPGTWELLGRSPKVSVKYRRCEGFCKGRMIRLRADGSRWPEKLRKRSTR
jgi:hypothetical protein